MIFTVLLATSQNAYEAKFAERPYYELGEQFWMVACYHQEYNLTIWGGNLRMKPKLYNTQR